MTHLIWRLLLVSLLCLGSGCASTSTQADANPDPFEGVNRAVFAFNDTLDRTVLSPVAHGYQWLTPNLIQLGVRNFFANLYDVNGAVNALLQGRLVDVAHNTGRFLVNTTVGMLGFVDVATEMGITPYRTDFGHTLALWQFKPGPYLMLPFFGPRTVRSGVGTAFDTVASVQYQLDAVTRNWLFALEIIDNRAALSAADDLITGDRYIFVRDAYLQQREYFTNGGVVKDTFSDFDDQFDWDE